MTKLLFHRATTDEGLENRISGFSAPLIITFGCPSLETANIDLLSKNNRCEHSFSSVLEHKNLLILPALTAGIRKILRSNS
uniref:Uncharacterized protein n=1 Tax=Romanomermis culicivorax TaxID=13658 RepID=A0A915KFP4_ROMCU